MLPLLQVSNVSKNFDGLQALSDVSFTIYEGERVSLVGENGSGKSTIIKIISGILEPTSGSITIGSKTKNSFTAKESMKSGVQVIYQDFSLYPNLTVKENIASNYFLSKNSFFISYKKMNEIALKALKKINLDISLEKLGSELTIAERQLVAIAKALLEDAKIIIMDEATTALTQKEIKNLLRIIEDLQKQGIAVLFVSHKVDEIQAVSDRCIFLKNGKKTVEKSTSELDHKSIVKHMSGLDYKDITPVLFEYKDNTPILEYRNVKTKNVNNISFSIHKGEVVGFCGLLGSGRSEIALSMFGCKPILDGDVFFNSEKVTFKSISDAMNMGIGYVAEDRLTESLFLDKSIGLNMTSTVYSEQTDALGFIDHGKLNELVSEWVENLSIKASSVNLPVSSLSGGNQQRVVISKWLMREGLKVLILNRPTVGVDVKAKQEINDVITKLAENEMAFALISDDLPEILNLCNKVYFVKNGAISNCIEGREITLNRLTEELNKD